MVTQSGLLERLRAQRENMQAGTTGAPMGIPDDDSDVAAVGDGPMVAVRAPTAPIADEETGRRVSLLETDRDDMKRRLEAVETNLRNGLAELRHELPTVITNEVVRLTTPTNESVVELSNRMSRVETDFTRERERWSTVVTSFDQRLDHRLKSFRSDVTVMLTGMGVLVLAMLMLILLRR